MMLYNDLNWICSIHFVCFCCIFKGFQSIINEDNIKYNHNSQNNIPRHQSSLYRPYIPAKLASNTHFFKAASQFRSVISLDSSTFMRHVIKMPRNFSIVVEFTMPNQDKRCPYCNDFHGEYQKLANSYYELQKHELFFVSLNFKLSEDIFKMFNVLTVPQYMVFSNKGKTKDHRNFKQIFSIKAESLAKNLRHITGIHVNIKSNSWSSQKILAVICVIFCLLMLQCENVRVAFIHRYFWALLTVVFLLLFSSGTMVNYMQKRPFAGRSLALFLENYVDRDGQFIVESLIISAIYTISTILAIFLHSISPLQNWKPIWKYGLEILFSTLLLVNISLLVKIYRYKNPHFPFKLLFD